MIRVGLQITDSVECSETAETYCFVYICNYYVTDRNYIFQFEIFTQSINRNSFLFLFRN